VLIHPFVPPQDTGASQSTKQYFLLIPVTYIRIIIFGRYG
jgi:hypothetical protein